MGIWFCLLGDSRFPIDLKGIQVPLESRIVAVADVFDAVASDRPYKKAWSNDEAFAMLNKMVGEELNGVRRLDSVILV